MWTLRWHILSQHINAETVTGVSLNYHVSLIKGSCLLSADTEPHPSLLTDTGIYEGTTHINTHVDEKRTDVFIIYLFKEFKALTKNASNYFVERSNDVKFSSITGQYKGFLK